MAQPQSSLRPSPPSGHYLTQAGLAAAYLRVLASLWPRLESDRSDFRLRLYALVTRFAQSSASLAADDYAERRAAAGVRGPFTVPHAAPPSVRQFDSNLNWSLSSLETDPATARKNLDGSMTRLVLDAGRETVISAVEKDPHAHAWARETQPGCCYWCAMIAGRGAVYTSARAAGEGNQFHNHDKCVAVPVFGAYEPTAHARQWQADWYDLKSRLGYTPSINQWRQHYEGRPIDGLST